ncbi:unnamed protein product [Adineta ricciae]|uniref:NHL repeat containing protein-like protein n=1 Tax=Adineta ricciae TaxID=249248 RepID=A0A813Q6Q1_ADIRI|nr:unnamed protein product [Adineta ricciae]
MFTIPRRFLVHTYVLLFVAFDQIASIQIKTFSSAIFITSDVINTFSNVTCDQCTCLAWTTQAVAWNCMMNTSTCQLISKYSATNGYLQITTNGSFFYLPSTTVGTTIAGYSTGYSSSGSMGLSHPHGLFISRNGTLYVVDTFNSRVQAFAWNSSVGSTAVPSSVLSYVEFVYVNENTSTIYTSDYNLHGAVLYPGNTTIPTAGQNLTCTTNRPYSASGLVGDSKGNLYIASSFCHTVLKLDGSNTNSIIRVAGSGTAGNGSSQLNTPYGLSLDEKNSILYVTDMKNSRIQKIFLNQNSTVGVTVAGGNGAGCALNQLNFPQGVTFSQKDGSIYVADTNNNRIVRWRINATEGVVVAGSLNCMVGTTSVLLNSPFDLKFGANETFLFVADMYNNRVQRFQLN